MPALHRSGSTISRTDDALAKAASSGRLHRNFQGYTDDDRPILLGFGASAVSRLPDGYVQNIADTTSYCRRMGHHELATARGRRLCDEDRVRARIIEELMCNFGVDLASVDPSGSYQDELALLRPLAADGLIEIRGSSLRMTEAGRPIVRVAAAVFDTFLQQDARLFSLAV